MRPMPQANPRSSARLVALIVGFLASLALRASAATVATDKADYAPGENVVITGSGWEPGETVVLILHEEPQLDPDLQLTAYADENGDFTNTDFSVDVFDIGVTFTLTATGDASGLTAETTFTDAPGTCTPGSGPCCKDNGTFWNTSQVCRAAAGDCDLPEMCTGTSSACPTDVFKASGTACTDDGNPCTLDQCDGTSATGCQHPLNTNTSTVCRAAAGPCDVAENCTGTTTVCPADVFRPPTFTCRAIADECDVPETCTGTSATCPTDAFKANGTACTADTNPCTRDVCSGTSATCTHPAGNAGVQCRAAADECDVAENCTGTNTNCPSDLKKAAGTACTPDSNPCTLDQCDGSSNSCQHPAGNTGAACPDDGDPCTTDTCDGTNTSCQHPPGNAGAVCRAAANDCDVEEECPVPPIIGFRDAAIASSGALSRATSLSISRPSGTLANDIMVASITAPDDASTPTIAAPAGWTSIVSTTSNGQNLRVSTYWKLAGTAGADPGPYTFTVSPSSRIAGGISAYFTVDTTNPINAS